MNRLTIVVAAAVLAGCATRSGFVERRLEPWRTDAVGDLSEVEGTILAVHDYSDNANRTDSLATFPHLHLEVQRTKGEVPGHPHLRVFDCHLALDANRRFTVGERVHLLFDEKGELEGVLTVLKGKTQEASNTASHGTALPRRP